MSDSLRVAEKRRAEKADRGRLVRDFLSDHPEIAQRLGVSLDHDDADLYGEFSTAVSRRPDSERRPIVDELYRRDERKLLPVRPMIVPSALANGATLADIAASPEPGEDTASPQEIREFHLAQARQLWRDFDSIVRQADQVEAMSARAQQIMDDPDSTPGDVKSAMGRVNQYHDALGRSWQQFQQEVLPSVVQHLETVSQFTQSPTVRIEIAEQIQAIQSPPVLDRVSATIKNLSQSFDEYAADAVRGPSVADRLRRNRDNDIENSRSIEDNTPRPSF